jgi:large subunit ribosomal protein L7/L12
MTEATLEVPAELKTLGDKIANLTLKDAKALSDYLESAHGIKDDAR